MADMALIDASPVTVRGPLKPLGTTVVTQARAFVDGDRLYIAQSYDRGVTVFRVDSYPAPPSEDIRATGSTTLWGEWSWTGCGCFSRWGTHTIEDLIALADQED